MCLELIKDIAQVAFYVTMGTLAVLTYMHARRTLFVPFASELYKAELRELLDVHELVRHKHLAALFEKFDLDRLFALNAKLMLECYFRVKFGGKYRDAFTDSWIIKTFPELSPSETVLSEAPLGNWGPTELRDPELRSSRPDWGAFRYWMVFWPQATKQTIDRIRIYQQSPLLPDSVKTELDTLGQSFFECLDEVARTLTAAAKEVPARYAKPASCTVNEDCTLNEEKHDWIMNYQNALNRSDSVANLAHAALAVQAAVEQCLTPNRLWRR